MLRPECERRLEIAVEIGRALARDPVDEIEREVVEAGLAKRVEGAADVVRAGAPLEHREQLRLEALRAERDAGDAGLAQRPGERGRDRLRVRLHGHLGRRRQGLEQSAERRRLGQRRSPAAEEHGLEPGREQPALELQLGEQRRDVGRVLVLAAQHGDEVAVAAARGAEGQVHVEVADGAAHFLSSFRLSTARNASCGTSTPPTCFIRFLPFFCFSSSLRLRVMSPP